MLGSVNPTACSAGTGDLLLRALVAARFMKSHWAKVFPRGTEELQKHVVRVTVKFFLPEPACLENVFEKRALHYYLTLAKGVACTWAHGGKGPGRTAWRKGLPELDLLEEACARLPIHHRPGGPLFPPPDDRLPIHLFCGSDAQERRDFTEQVIDATTEEVRRMREELPSLQLLGYRPVAFIRRGPAPISKPGGIHETTTAR